ncbi:MAG: signal peptidase II [Clostridia bacterium]|nr:signal peptidase II [Clostridia bacterium]
MLVWILIIIGVVIVDQVTKLLTVHFLDVGESVTVIPGLRFGDWEGNDIFRFTYVQNDGAAFGMLGEHRWVFMIISTVAIVAMLIYLWKFRPPSKWACTAISLIIGGGIGNMIDRVHLEYVIDFLDFSAFPELWKWVFNVADACVCVGGGILFVWCVCSLIQEFREGKRAKARATETGEGESEQSEEQSDQEE